MYIGTRVKGAKALVYESRTAAVGLTMDGLFYTMGKNWGWMGFLYTCVFSSLSLPFLFCPFFFLSCISFFLFFPLIADLLFLFFLIGESTERGVQR